MSASFNSSLTTNLDWVRFLIRDTDITNPLLSDEEITAVLAEQTSALAVTGSALKYYAAAECLRALHTSWMSRGRGIASKKVSQLSITYGSGIGINIDIALQNRIAELRTLGAQALAASSSATSPYPFRVSKSLENR